jgi:hypothetical protein
MRSWFFAWLRRIRISDSLQSILMGVLKISSELLAKQRRLHLFAGWFRTLDRRKKFVVRMMAKKTPRAAQPHLPHRP